MYIVNWWFKLSELHNKSMLADGKHLEYSEPWQPE